MTYIKIDNAELKKKERVGLVIKKRFRWIMKLGYRSLQPNYKRYINSQFRKQLFVYNNDLKGIIIRLRNIKITTPIEARLTRRIIVKCCLDLYMFKPEPGCTLTGVVLKTGSSFVCCLLYNALSLLVMKPDDESEDTWSGKHVSNGDTVSFKVEGMDLKKYAPYVTSRLFKIVE